MTGECATGKSKERDGERMAGRKERRDKDEEESNKGGEREKTRGTSKQIMTGGEGKNKRRSEAET